MSRQTFQNVGREPRHKIFQDAQIVMKNSEFYIYFRISYFWGFLDTQPFTTPPPRLTGPTRRRHRWGAGEGPRLSAAREQSW